MSKSIFAGYFHGETLERYSVIMAERHGDRAQRRRHRPDVDKQ
ncbi:MAG: hypothetical protein SFX18_09500 [Pirellulales bacterium]|nr:hypothetical protein [Pirellulales bacterium]